MAIRTQFLSEPARLELEEATRAVTDLMNDANRKARIFMSELKERSTRKNQYFVAGALAIFMSFVICSLLVSSAPSNIAIVVLAAVAAGLAFALIAVVIVMEQNKTYRRLHADSARFNAIIKIMKFMRNSDFHATATGRDILLLLSKDLKAVSDDYKDIDAVEIELFQSVKSTNPSSKTKRYDRIKPRNSTVRLVLGNGERRMGRIRDVSRSGVALELDKVIDSGSVVTIGSTRARVVRTMDRGAAFEFVKPFPAEKFSDAVRL